MKPGIHPEYKLARVHCACGNEFHTRSTQDDIHLDVCSVCHPYFTGKQRLMDTAGRVERFRRKWGAGAGDSMKRDEPAEKSDEPAEAEAEAPEAPAAKAGKAKKDAAPAEADETADEAASEESDEAEAEKIES